MSTYVIFTVLVALSIVGLSVLFSLKAHELWSKGKRTSCVVAITGSIIALTLFVNLIVHLFPISFNSMLKQDALCILAGTILAWSVASFMKKGWRKMLLILSPILFWGFMIVYVALPLLLGANLPLSKSEVEFTEQTELAKVLGDDNLPEMKFSEAWETPYGYIVDLRLINEADSSQLTSVFENLKAQHPLQIMENNHTGRMFMCVDNDIDRYINIIFDKSDVKIVYGDVWGKNSTNKNKLDNINAPLPEYKYLTFMSEKFGPDWVQNERIEFIETIPLSWLNQIKQCAKSDENWSYEDGRDSHNIKYSDSQYYIEIKLYKNLNGVRKVADIQWGTY